MAGRIGKQYGELGHNVMDRSQVRRAGVVEDTRINIIQVEEQMDFIYPALQIYMAIKRFLRGYGFSGQFSRQAGPRSSRIEYWCEFKGINQPGAWASAPRFANTSYHEIKYLSAKR